MKLLNSVVRDLPTEATLYHLLLREGFCSSAEVVAWADGWILRLDTIPDELVSISLSGGNKNDILSALGKLALPTLSEHAFGQLCQMLLERLEADAGALTEVNSLLWRMHYDSVNGERPLDFEPSTELYWFHEWENLIPDGYEETTMADLRKQVREFLQSYADSSVT